ncbi:hypothetical protein ZWY2020_001875 [Hordeum vulgare]|nr:hypothetical protein ZWY2020_001875 [Hordeum vulgare]
MGGGNGIVDGFRRLFHRRTPSGSVLGSSNQSSAGEDSSELEAVEDLDLVGLRPIRVPKRKMPLPVESHKKNIMEKEFFTEYGEASQYQIQEVVGKGSYGVVAAAIDTRTGERVAIKKINDVFEHVSDATRILRELLRALKYIHGANVFHRDLKPKNILANADCKLKICDFGLARVSFNDAPSAIFWTDYVATRWYRAPELCGSFFSKYTPAIDIWSIGCIFAELLTGRPLFPGKNVVHQLDIITDLLGTPSSETLSRIRNEKARRYLSCMRKKHPVPLTQKFPNADPLAVRLLGRLLAFDPKDRPSAEEALADPYFASLANVEREPSRHPISKLEFEFERRKVTKDDVRELIYREILEYHPQMLEEYMKGGDQISFLYPSGVDRFKRQFAHLEEHYSKGERGSPLQRKHASLPRQRVGASNDSNNEQHISDQEMSAEPDAHGAVSPQKPQDAPGVGQNGLSPTSLSSRTYLKALSIRASKCVGVPPNIPPPYDDAISEETEGAVDGLSEKVSKMHA